MREIGIEVARPRCRHAVGDAPFDVVALAFAEEHAGTAIEKFAKAADLAPQREAPPDQPC